jgi:hypothetical protein
MKKNFAFVTDVAKNGQFNECYLPVDKMIKMKKNFIGG